MNRIMMLRAALSFGTVAFIIVALGFGQSFGQAPEPTPSPVTSPTPVQPSSAPAVPLPGSGSICAPAQYQGGQSVIVDNLLITFPGDGGYTAGGGIADPGGEFVRVCFVQGDSAIFFDLSGNERSRIVNVPSANAVLDEIARSIRLVGPSPTPASSLRQIQQTATPVATPTPAGTIRAPTTGTAGLR
jgi:hypothetical protein